MSTKKRNQNLSEELKFEQKLFQSLKHYGYLFPESIKDVDRFEELYGDTEIEIPEHLQSLDALNTNKELPLDFGLAYNVAALSADEPNPFEKPDKSDSDKNDDKGLDKNESKKPSNK